MNRDANFRNRTLPFSNPLANALVVIVGLLSIAVFVVIGVVAFFALAAAIVVLICVLRVRIWWLQKHSASPRQHKTRQASGESTQEPVAVIEGEYQVLPADRDTNES